MIDSFMSVLSSVQVPLDNELSCGLIDPPKVLLGIDGSQTGGRMNTDSPFIPRRSTERHPVFRFILVLAAIALIVGAIILSGATSIMPWENHYGEPMGCWNESTRHALTIQNRLEAYEYLYCK
jgi:hypothetical protein